MSVSIKDMASKYYPKFWNKDRLVKLVQCPNADFTESDYEQVTGEKYQLNNTDAQQAK